MEKKTKKEKKPAPKKDLVLSIIVLVCALIVVGSGIPLIIIHKTTGLFAGGIAMVCCGAVMLAWYIYEVVKNAKAYKAAKKAH